MEMNDTPRTIEELHRFYAEVFTPLYNRFQLAHTVPQEINAEVAAALDHLLYAKPAEGCSPFREEDIRLAAGHLKRATFDGFKVIFDEEIRKPRERFTDDRYADVHDGRFRQDVDRLWHEAKRICEEARTLERKSRTSGPDAWDKAFRKWSEILPVAERFAEFAADPAVIRARGVSRRRKVALVIWQLLLLLAGWALSKFL